MSLVSSLISREPKDTQRVKALYLFLYLESNILVSVCLRAGIVISFLNTFVSSVRFKPFDSQNRFLSAEPWVRSPLVSRQTFV